jgi:glycosidase
MRNIGLFFLLLLAQGCATAQQENIYNDDPLQKIPLGVDESEYFIREPTGAAEVSTRVEPPFWWTGMNNPRLEILIHDKDVADLSAGINYPGVRVVGQSREENPNYLFIEVEITPAARPGSFTINVGGPAEMRQYPYELRARSSDPAHVQGIDASDFIYLLMPDRFANGDPKNDSVEGMAQTGVNREKVFFRHGGDLIGVMEHLDYLEDLGVTALWLNPVLENDQPYESYHGYAVTDHYAIDARLGTNENYRQLVQLAHERGLKVIMDVIFNHVGDRHWFIEDLPSADWIHQWPEYTKTTYRATTLMDPHAASADRREFSDGWFDRHMPDLNQQNPHLANYLIQNSIWWAEYTGHDGYRIDTYAYCDQEFMAEWNRRMKAEFPAIGIFGETWVHGPGVQAWFVGSNRIGQGLDTNLPGVTDFQVYYGINEALAEEPGWTSGISRLYYTLAQDFLYPNPRANVLFLDNHDLARFYTVVGEDFEKYRSGLALLLTLRGIPMINYGTELLFTGSGGSFGEGGRIDFPGGWRRDPVNLFKPAERSKSQQRAFDLLRRLARYRRDHRVLHSGELTQFLPQEGVYGYVRHNATERILIVFNASETARPIDFSHFAPYTTGVTTAYDVLSGETVDLTTRTLAPKATWVLELR